MTNPMIERVAKAIGDDAHGYVDPVATPNTWEWSMSVARTAIEAMREPTIEMLVSAGVIEGWGEEYNCPNSDEAHIEWWQTMIDAALEK